jgi:hypothetical protein
MKNVLRGEINEYLKGKKGEIGTGNIKFSGKYVEKEIEEALSSTNCVAVTLQEVFPRPLEFVGRQGEVLEADESLNSQLVLSFFVSEDEASEDKRPELMRGVIRVRDVGMSFPCCVVRQEMVGGLDGTKEFRLSPPLKALMDLEKKRKEIEGQTKTNTVNTQNLLRLVNGVVLAGFFFFSFFFPSFSLSLFFSLSLSFSPSSLSFFLSLSSLTLLSSLSLFSLFSLFSLSLSLSLLPLSLLQLSTGVLPSSSTNTSSTTPRSRPPTKPTS